MGFDLGSIKIECSNQDGKVSLRSVWNEENLTKERKRMVARCLRNLANAISPPRPATKEGETK